MEVCTVISKSPSLSGQYEVENLKSKTDHSRKNYKLFIGNKFCWMRVVVSGIVCRIFTTLLLNFAVYIFHQEK